MSAVLSPVKLLTFVNVPAQHRAYRAGLQVDGVGTRDCGDVDAVRACAAVDVAGEAARGEDERVVIVPPVRLEISMKATVPLIFPSPAPSIVQVLVIFGPTSVSVPPPPVIEALPVHPESVKVFALPPPVRFATSMPDSVSCPASPRDQRRIGQRKSRRILARHHRVGAPAPSSVPVPVQPLTVKVFALPPPVRFATSILQASVSCVIPSCDQASCWSA